MLFLTSVNVFKGDNYITVSYLVETIIFGG